MIASHIQVIYEINRGIIRSTPSWISGILSTPKKYHMPGITLAEAKTMAERYLNNRASLLKNQYTIDVLPVNETFSKEDVIALINQTGCVSFRVHYAMKQDLNVCAILTAVDSQGRDILIGENVKIIEEGQRCPPNCSTTFLTS